ncbi:MAG: anti-sigma factor family protein [Planctomycetota bacterium]|jgi:hypothetical protein
MTTPHPELHDLTALAYDMIEGSERGEMLEHLSECESCREYYDSYRDEQALVRDVVVEDARSGPAEASALQKTLTLLAELDGDETAPEVEAAASGKLLRLPALWIAAEIAAVAIVAVGLFMFLKPDGADVSGTPEIKTIADEVKAPVEVRDGTVLVGNDSGEWEAASAIPADEWVMVGDNALSFTQANGALATASSGAVFRISVDEIHSGEPIIYVLHGDVAVDALAPVTLRAGDQGYFYAMPGSAMKISATAAEHNWTNDSRYLRRAKALRSMEVKSEDGKVVFSPISKANRMVVFEGGESVAVGRSGSYWHRADEEKFSISIEIAAKKFHAELLKEESLRFGEILRELEARPTLEIQKLEILKTDLRQEMAEMEAMIVEFEKAQGYRPREGHSTQKIVKRVGMSPMEEMFKDEGVIVLRGANGSYTVFVTGEGKPQIFKGKNLEDVASQMPEEYHKHLPQNDED